MGGAHFLNATAKWHHSPTCAEATEGKREFFPQRDALGSLLSSFSPDFAGWRSTSPFGKSMRRKRRVGHLSPVAFTEIEYRYKQ